MSRAERSKPRCELEFHTPTAFYATEGKFDPTDDFLSASTAKQLDATAGTFNIQLTYRNLGTKSDPETWYDRLNPMDLVVIKMGRPPERLDTVMVGLIDEVRRTRGMGSDGKPTRRVVVSGRDFGKVFLKAVLEFFPQFDEGTLPLEMLDGVDVLLKLKEFFLSGEFENGTAAQLIYKGVTRILYNLMVFETTVYDPATHKPTLATLAEILRFRLCRTNAMLPFYSTVAEFEGSIWNFFTSALNKPFFELFVDTRRPDEIMRMVPPSITEHDSYGIGEYEQTWGEDNAKVCLILRPTPFDKGNWDSLETHTIADFDIINENLGRSDHENQNMWRVRPVNNLFGTAVYDHEVMPQINISNVKHHGISFYQPDLQGLSAEEDSDEWADIIQFGNALSKKLQEWYWRNIWFENGNMTLHGNGKIKVGQRLHNPDEYHNHIYYVEGVTQDFINNSSWTTSVTLTRGQDYVEAAAGGVVTVPTEIKTYSAAELNFSNHLEQQEQSDSAEPQYHIVAAGDTLWSICMRYYKQFSPVLVDGILRENPQITDPNRIYAGQRFIIPPL